MYNEKKLFSWQVLGKENKHALKTQKEQIGVKSGKSCHFDLCLNENGENAAYKLFSARTARGGFEIQINVTDKALLERARANPEEYRDLIVRIGGYSDYFTKLSPKMQEEVILRTEHVI